MMTLSTAADQSLLRK